MSKLSINEINDLVLFEVNEEDIVLKRRIEKLDKRKPKPPKFQKEIKDD